MCGHCGYGMQGHYNAQGWGYQCASPDPASRLPRGCFSVGGKRIDREVARRFLELATAAGAEQWH